MLHKNSVVIEMGDILCLHTGFAEVVLQIRSGSLILTKLHSCCAVLDRADERLLMDHG